MKLPNRKIIALHQALHALDSPKPVDGEKPKPLPFKFRYAVGRCIAELSVHVQAIDKARMSAIEPFSGGKAGIDGNDPNFMKAQEVVNRLLDTEEEVDLYRIKVAEIEACDLSPAVLAALMPMIDDEG